MPGPGEYVADETQGITYVEDLPKPKLVQRSRNYKRRPCPLCEHSAYRLRTVSRTLHDIGDPLTGRPRDIILTYSTHRCPQCNHYFNADMLDLALPRSHYPHRVVSMAVRGWSLTMDYRTGRPRGIYGESSGYLYLWR